MADSGVRPAVEEQAPGLTQWQRVANAFSAPSKTFEDIKRGHKSWWLPYLFAVIVGYVLFATVTTKVGWPQVAENNIKMNPKQAERMDQLPPDQRANGMKIAAAITEGISACIPVVLLIFGAVVSLVLWPTINFGFGGNATYGQILAVYFYAGLPGLLPPLIGTAALLAGLAPESFNINNIAGTNVAYYLSIDDTNKALYAFLSQIDIISIWMAILLSIGIATVAGKKRSAGYISVFGWWGVWTLLRVIGGLLSS